jgi:hypothetical protein
MMIISSLPSGMISLLILSPYFFILKISFGDITTQDKGVFPFFPDRPCNGFQEVLTRYIEITPNVKLSGPTSFAPLIYGITMLFFLVAH